MRIHMRITVQEAPRMQIHTQIPVPKYPRMRIFGTFLNNRRYYQMVAAFLRVLRILEQKPVLYQERSGMVGTHALYSK